MKITFLSMILAGSAVIAAPVYSDDYSRVLKDVVEGNRGLKADRAVVDAETADNLTGLSLPNPEVEFAYQWGSPATSPDKTMLDVSQSFDFATLSGSKKRVARSRNLVSERGFDVMCRDVAGEADRIMTEAVYLHKLSSLYARNDSLLSNMEAASAARVERGDMTSIDYNAVVIQRRNAATETMLHQIDVDANHAELARLAGGEIPLWDADEYMAWTLPANFESWWLGVQEQSPELGVARAEVAVARDEVSLRRREGLPTFSLGYTSEMVTGDNHYGVSVGVELPLWGNHGRVKAAKAAAAATEIKLDDARYMLRTDVEIKYKRAQALYKAYEDVLDIREKCGNSVLLAKAFAEGVMPYHEYIAQLLTLIELDKKVLETERDYQLSLVELRTASADWD